ncbi:cupin domain-containing protein [Xylariaceae sp. FL0016]|nr:cupin domain-containing protein [Xylariaceae sp. FL0016]
MAASDMHNPAEGYVQTPHPVQGLPRVVRHITGHDAEGKSVFLATDIGDHHRELVNKSAIANIIYSTSEHPVELNGEADLKYARENEPGITAKNGTVCRMIDFAPGGVSPMHRVNSLDYAIVIEGVFRMILDSGEERIMQRGDIAVQRSTSHRWINVTGNGLLPARILFVLLDVKDLVLDGEKVQGELGVLEKDYVGLPGHGS